jgi:uncharacterized surface protein with fasciclin (FAS1) repeats
MTNKGWSRTLGALGLALALGVTAPEARSQGYGSSQPNLVEVASAAGTFSTLVAAVQAAGLAETLAGTGPFTVFAPTDEAFAKLPAGTVESLLANPELLRAVLTYHVVPGRVMASDVVGLRSANTVQGGALPIRVHDGKVHVGEATVIQTDIRASNGVIHVIDTVLLPPNR